MSRSFVPIYNNKTANYTLYYDYKENYFFKVKVSKQHSFLPMLSGTAGIVIYALFKTTVLDWGDTSPTSVVLFSLLISCVISLVLIGGISYSIKKNIDVHKVIVTLSQEEMRHYLYEGNKWFKSNMLLLCFLVFFVCLNIVIIFHMPNSGLFFFTNIGLSTVMILLFWGMKPIKRKKIYKLLKKELENNDKS